MLAGRIADVTTSETSLPGSEGQEGIELIRDHFSAGRENTEIEPVFRHPTLRVDDSA